MEKQVLLVTTQEIPGYDISEYKGIVYGEVVVPNGLLGAFTSGTFFTIDALARAREEALDALKKNAAQVGANAVAGVDIDISDLNGRGVLVSANGTAVTARPARETDIRGEEIAITQSTASEHLIPLKLKLHFRSESAFAALRIVTDRDIDGILADLLFEDVFGDTVVLEKIRFLRFAAGNEYTSDWTEVGLSKDTLIGLAKVSVRIRKVLSQGERTVFEDAAMEDVGKLASAWMNKTMEKHTEDTDACGREPAAIESGGINGMLQKFRSMPEAGTDAGRCVIKRLERLVQNENSDPAAAFAEGHDILSCYLDAVKAVEAGAPQFKRENGRIICPACGKVQISEKRNVCYHCGMRFVK